MWGLTLWIALISLAVLFAYPKIQGTAKIVLHSLASLPFFTLVYLFIVNDDSILVVAANGGSALPLKYKIAATWAAREGPILLWAGLMALLSLVYAGNLEGEDDSTSNLRLRFAHGFTALLIILAMNLKPFELASEGQFFAGLNPLLQTDLMVIHPPLIFFGYSFCMHLTFIGISSFLQNSEQSIAERIYPVARLGFFVLTLGIGLGGLWAYLILDWGGYWAWDPVETGSFLPWLALVILSHLRTKPGSKPAILYQGVAISTGALSLFATLVTRAGGVWASSVHTFVQSSDATPPSTVLGRMFLLDNSDAGVEVISYLFVLFLLIGIWLTMARSYYSGQKPGSKIEFYFMAPIVFAFLAALFGGQIYSGISEVLIIVPLAMYIHSYYLSEDFNLNKQNSTELRQKLEGISHVAVFFIIAYISESIIALLCLCFLVPLRSAKVVTKQWGWALAGVTVALSSSWTGLVDVFVAIALLLLFITPWLLKKDDPDKKQTSVFKLLTKKDLMKYTLYSTVVVSSTYLILTLVILLSSIDQVSLEAHEVLGSPFILALPASFFAYNFRKSSPKTNQLVILLTVSLSVIMAIFFPENLGPDSNEQFSEYINRGNIGWLLLPMLLVSLPGMTKEVYSQWKSKTKSSKISRWAHFVHLGLILLLIGHVFSTTLVDRGDSSHRITMVKDEMVIVGDYGYMFKELNLESEPEVGDGYLGVEVEIYSMNNGEESLIGIVNPGTTRFDSSGFARSEVDRHSTLTGDLVFIFDGSQASGLMREASINGIDSIELIRITVYELPFSHLVWSGWVIMLVGMLGLWYEGKLTSTSKDHYSKDYEEE